MEVASMFRWAGGSCLSIIWLAFTIYALIHILSSHASVGAKALWIVAILVFPIVGPILWFFLGPRNRH